MPTAYPSTRHPRRIAASATAAIRVLLPLAALLPLGAGCSGGPQLDAGPSANPSQARGLLVAASADGPVPLEIDTAPPTFAGGAAEVAGIATTAVSALGARFQPMGLGSVESTRRRVVFRFEQTAHDPTAICAGNNPRGILPPPPVRLYAVFCDGTRPVADIGGTAAGTSPDDPARLVSAVTDRMFPGGSGSYSYFPGVSLGVGVGSGGGGWGGGWGLGGGLHF
jgi:hypothetical protein